MDKEKLQSIFYGVCLIFIILPPHLSAQTSTLCASTFDLVFVVDNSGSIRDNPGPFDNWELILQFNAGFAARFRVGTGSGEMVAAAVDFGHDGAVQFEFQSDATTLDSQIRAMQYRTALESTNTADGILVAIRDLFGQSSTGDRPGVDDVMIILTDGKATDSGLAVTYANQAKSRGITIYCIGVTSSVNETEIKLLTSNPVLDEGYWLVSDFTQLEASINGIASKICVLEADPTTPTTTTTTTTTPPTTTTTPTTTTIPQVATSSVNVVPQVGASTTSNSTIIIVVVVLSVLLLLGLLVLLLVCLYVMGCCVCCGATKRKERIIDRRKAVIVPFSTAVVKPEPQKEEPVFAHMTTQCDIRDPIPLPKPPPPPEIQKEVIIKPVCSTCKADIEKCECEEVISIPVPIHEHEQEWCAACNQTCPDCQPSTCPQCQPVCPDCHNGYYGGTGCRVCDNSFHNHSHGHIHGHRSHHGSETILHPTGLIHPHDHHTHSKIYGRRYMRKKDRHSHYVKGHYIDTNHSLGDVKRRHRRYATKTPGYYTDTDPGLYYTHRSGRSSAVSDADSYSSKIYLVPNAQSTRTSTGVTVRAIEPPATIERGDTILTVHSDYSMDEAPSVHKRRKKKNRKRYGSRQELVGASASEAESVGSKKSYVYLPLDHPEKLKDDTQSYLNRLYTTSRSSIHADD